MCNPIRTSASSSTMRIFLLLMSSPFSKSYAHRYFPEFLPLLFLQSFSSIHRPSVAPAEASSNNSKRLSPLAAFPRNHVIFRECAWLWLLPQSHPSPPPSQKVPSLPKNPYWVAKHLAGNSSSAGAHLATNKSIPRGLFQ